MERKLHLPRLLTRRLRGDLEDTVTYILFSMPLALFTLWFGVDTYKLAHTHMVVYGAAQAAAVSAATQASYSVGTSVAGAGFTPSINTDMASYIANQTFQLEQNTLGLNQIVNIENTNVTYPFDTEVTYSVTVSYVPQGLYAAIDVLGALFASGQIPPTPPAVTWTVSPTANVNGQTV